MERVTIYLEAKADVDVSNFVIKNVREYKVGYQLIWIEYNESSILAVARKDFANMTVVSKKNVVLEGFDFERVNC